MICLLEHILKAKSLANKLSFAGHKLSSAKFNAIIYHNIEGELHSIITALNLWSDPIYFHELLEQHVAYEILLKSLYDLPMVNFAA